MEWLNGQKFSFFSLAAEVDILGTKSWLVVLP